MPDQVEHRCRCGAVRVNVSVPDRGAGTRVTCYCADCQTAALLHEKGTDVLTPAGGTDIWQTTPDRLEVVSGAEHLKIIRLSPRGLMRWHAGCCGTPMLNTMANLKLPFVGMVLRQSERQEADQTYGKIRCHVSTGSAIPGKGAPSKDKGFNRAGFNVIVRMLAAVLSGRAAASPLRDENGQAIAPVEMISKDARKAARPPHLN